MTAQSNGIDTRQNEPFHIDLRKAARRYFDAAQSLMVAQVVLTVVVPLIGLVVAWWNPASQPGFALFGLVVTAADEMFMERWLGSWSERGAKCSEWFDCNVLNLPWDEFNVGERPDHEDVRRASRGVSGKFLDWYPARTSEVPMHVGRVVVQRLNARYDRELRKDYANLLALIGFVTLVLALLRGAWGEWSVVTFALALTPMTPLFQWLLRTFFKQRDAVAQATIVQKHTEVVWDNALSGEYNAERCLRESRALQTAVYQRRAIAPPIPPGLYPKRRTRLEEEMDSAAERYVDTYLARHPLAEPEAPRNAHTGDGMREG